MRRIAETISILNIRSVLLPPLGITRDLLRVTSSSIGVELSKIKSSPLKSIEVLKGKFEVHLTLIE